MSRSVGAAIHVNETARQDRVIFLAVPTFGTVSIRWHAHLMQLQNPVNRSVYHAYGLGWEVGQARNYLVQQALDLKTSQGFTVSHVFFVDDDVLVPPYALSNLLARNRPIVSRLYYAKTPAPQPLLLLDAFGGTAEDLVRESAPNSLIECYAHGMGCTLIELRVFRELREAGLAPDETLPNGQVLPQWFKTTRDARIIAGHGEPIAAAAPGSSAPIVYNQTEDVYFLSHAAELGYRAAVDTGVFGFHWQESEKRAYPLHLWEEYLKTGDVTIGTRAALAPV